MFSGDFQDQNEVFNIPIDLTQIPKEICTKRKTRDGKGNYFDFKVKVEVRVYDTVDVTISLCHDGKILATYPTRL